MNHPLLLFSLLLSFTALSQAPCVEATEGFSVTEVMPEPSPDLAVVTRALNTAFSPAECGLAEGNQLAVIYKVNCKGEDFDYRAFEVGKDTLSCAIATFLQDALTWSIALQLGHPVDFSGTLVYTIERGQFVLTSRSDQSSEKKKNRRR